MEDNEKVGEKEGNSNEKERRKELGRDTTERKRGRRAKEKKIISD